MSAVIIRDDVEPRIEELAHLMGWDVRLAAGTMRYLWRGSQSVNATTGTPEQILRWAKEPDPHVGQLLIAALLNPAVRLLKRSNGELLEIIGNPHEVAKKKVREARAVKGAKARWKAGGSKGSDSENTPPGGREGGDSASASSERKESDASSIFKSDANAHALNLPKPSQQKNALRSKDPSSSPPGSAVWDAYAGAYFARYNVAPVRDAKTNSQCKHMVTALGVDAAIAVVRFYVAHNDAFYVRKSHDLGLCLADCRGLHTQMLNGKTVTAATAAVKDRQASNVQAAKEALRLLEERDAKG